jgi:hypothetical protein
MLDRPAPESFVDTEYSISSNPVVFIDSAYN